MKLKERKKKKKMLYYYTTLLCCVVSRQIKFSLVITNLSKLILDLRLIFELSRQIWPTLSMDKQAHWIIFLFNIYLLNKIHSPYPA